MLEKFYKNVPIGITVEGSNVLTKNLIIFGQGLNKSHPYIYKILEAIDENDVSKFNKISQNSETFGRFDIIEYGTIDLG